MEINSRSDLNRFFKWAYGTRADMVKDLYEGKMTTKEKLFLSFTSHDPVFISNGPAGLNGSVKGIGFCPKPEFMEKALEDYNKHIATYSKENHEYSRNGLEVLMKNLYSDEAIKNIDFKHLYGIEMAYSHSYQNYSVNNEATLVFYQPPAISFELRGKMELIGKRYDINDPIENSSLDFLQQFVNAQHDCYHMPNPNIWKTRLVYRFTIEEIWDKSTGPNGFGKKIEF